MSSIHDSGPSSRRVRIENIAILVIMATCVGVLVWFFTASSDPSNCVIETKYNRALRAITNVTDSVHGAFFLGSGQVNGVSKFQIKEVLADGSVYVRDILQSDAITYEDVREGQPWVEYKVERNKVTNSGCDASNRPEALPSGASAWYEIHIPAGSVLQIVDMNTK